MPRQNNLRQVPALNILNSDTPNILGEHLVDGKVVPDRAPGTMIMWNIFYTQLVNLEI